MDMLDAIKQIINKRKKDNIYPETAPVIEVKNLMNTSEEDFKRQGAKLREDGVIKLHRTINGYNIILI